MWDDYYDCRASEYEEIYCREDPVRQKELKEIATAMKNVLAGRRVLEIACGTGYWTRIAAAVAGNILENDISNKMLSIAKAKKLPTTKVRFVTGDAYSLDAIQETFDAGLLNFWLSHVRKSRLSEFLCGFHRRLISGAVVFMADNVYVLGIGGELITRLRCGDTFKRRDLSDGSEYEVVKNYYSAEQLHEVFRPFSCELKIRMGKCFWWVSYLMA